MILRGCPDGDTLVEVYEGKHGGLCVTLASHGQFLPWSRVTGPIFYCAFPENEGSGGVLSDLPEGVGGSVLLIYSFRPFR